VPRKYSGAGVDSPGLWVDSPGLGVDSPGQAVDSLGLGVDSPGQGVDRPGQVVDSPGQGVDSPGQGVDRLHNPPERKKVQTSRRSRLQPAKLPVTEKELAFSWVPSQVVFRLPDDLFGGFQPSTLISIVALVKLAIKMAVSVFSGVSFSASPRHQG